MSNTTFCATFTKTGGIPATGLTLAEISLYLTTINRSTGVVAVVWNGTQNPTAEVTNTGSYIRILDIDLDTYDYVFMAQYTGATALDSNTAATSGLSTLSAADVRTAVGLASANLDTQLAAIVADTAELQTEFVDGGRLDLLIDAILADTNSLNDTALPEITGAADIPATPTLRQAIMLGYMLARNGNQVTATERRVMNDAGTEVLDATVSDDGSTFSQGKLGDA